MLDSLMGNMEEMQEQMQEQLSGITLEAEAGDGAVKVTANGLRQITTIALDTEKLDTSDPEMMEDLLLVAINQVLEKAAAKEQEASQELMKNILPPGLMG